jgi:hypothetical protein
VKMKKLLLSLLFLAACRDQYGTDFDPYDASQIDGLWRGEMQPYWTYHFSDGMLSQRIYDFGAPLIERYWAYKTRCDTIFLEDIITPNTYRTFTVYFHTDSTATLTEVGVNLQLKQNIKRF